MTSSIGPGTVLGGRYRLDDLLSENDGARFWRGTDTVLGRSVAVNAVPTDDPRAERLLDAARKSATVTESHLLRVLDCDEADGISWVVNEWGSGTSLDIMLQRGALPASRAAWLTREVAETIAAAHTVGVAHGRLTPESVLVTEAGAVKLIGFVVTAAIEGPTTAGDRAQRRGYGALDAREVDVIDLAGILYAAVSGRWPGISPSSVPDAPFDSRGPLRPRQVRAGVPRMLDAICERVLRKEGYEHALPIETAQEILAALSDEVGDPLAGAPVDVPSMYVEPTVALHRDQLPGVAPDSDPEETQAAAPPIWDAPAEHRGAGEQPDLPPYEELPDRPLFASTERRPTLPASSMVADRGSSAWLFGDDEPPVPAEEESRGRRPLWVALAVVAALLVLAAMVLAFQLGRGDGDEPAGAGGPSASTSPGSDNTVLDPVSVHDFDPEGKNAKGKPAPSENPAEVPLATDGKRGTGWKTLSYTSAALGGLKSGVGLLVDLGADRSVGSLELTFKGSPTTFEVYAAPAGVSDPPTGLAELDKLGQRQADQRSATLRLGTPVRTRFVLVWLTQLPRQGHGYRGEIDELRVLS